MDLTVRRTVGATVDSTVGWTVGLTVDPTVDPTVEITGQPVSRTQASDASGRMPRYEAKCVQRTRFQWGGAVPLCADIKGTELPPCQYIDTTWKAIDCATTLPLTVFTARAMLALQALY